MTPIDSLHVGQWVAIVGDKHIKEMQDPDGKVKMIATFSGEPCQIKAISLPFICVEKGDHIAALDTRHHEVVRLGKGYVRAMQQAKSCPGPQEEVAVCPFCSSPMLQDDTGHRDDSLRFHCDGCNFHGFIP